MRVCRLLVAARHDGVQLAGVVVDHIRTVSDVDAGCDYAGRVENTLPAFGVTGGPDGAADRDARDVGARDDLDGDTDTGDTGGVGEWGC